MECLLCQGKGRVDIPLCHPCQRELPWHRASSFGFRYAAPIDQWIAHLKFQQELKYAKLLGTLLAEKIKKQRLPERPQLIIPIPLHTVRLCGRGFNQALEIAKHLSREIDIPLDFNALKRTRLTKPQSQLSEKERSSNLVRAFRCVKHFRAHHVAIFDDVVTTGNTMKNACHALEEVGVKKIEIWASAQAERQNTRVQLFSAKRFES